MPALQVVDLNPKIIPRETSPLEKTLSSFSNKLVENEQNRRETDAIRKHYQQYLSEGQNINQAYVNLNSDPNLSPTTRVNETNKLLKLAEINAKLQEDSKKKLAEADKIKAQKEKESREVEKHNRLIEKENAEKTRIKESVGNTYNDLVSQGLMSQEEADHRKKYDSEATARNVYTHKTKTKPQAKSEFQKTLERKEAEEVVKLEQDIPKVKDALANLDYIENTFDKYLTGPKGYVKSFWGSESAKEVENLGFTAIEPIIKLFNPVGPIPVQKVKIIREEFQPNASDTKTKFQGKINALRRIGSQALGRAQERVAILRQYEGKPPPEVINKFDRDSENLRDMLVDQQAYDLNTKDLKEDDLVKGLYDKQTGKALKGIPKKKADEFMQQGIVTYG